PQLPALAVSRDPDLRQEIAAAESMEYQPRAFRRIGRRTGRSHGKCIGLSVFRENRDGLACYLTHRVLACWQDAVSNDEIKRNVGLHPRFLGLCSRNREQ